MLSLLGELDVWGRSEDDGLIMRVPSDLLDVLPKIGFNITDLTEEHVSHLEWMQDEANQQVCNLSGEECANSGDAFYNQYQRKAAIDARLASFVTNFPDLASEYQWGRSFEGRIQQGIRITSPVGGTNKRIIFYFCGEHAREWLPPMFCTFMAENLVNQYATNPVVRNLVDTYEFHILPLMNPDGSEFSFSSSMWRKNRQPNQGSTCIGTDLNRNYEFQWNTGGSSANPCTDTFHGARPWNAPETANLRDYGNRFRDRLLVGVDVHAFGNMWMHPWGYTRTLSRDNARMLACGNAARDAIRGVNGLTFRTGSIANVIYVASGSSCDSFYGLWGTVYSYAPEVRGNSFQPPAANINPSNAELWAGMIAGVQCAQFFEANPEAEAFVPPVISA